MKLLVRNQNRMSLEEHNGFRYVCLNRNEQEFVYPDEWKKEEQWHCIVGLNNIILGKYASERRCIEIIDEIENFIFKSFRTYKMPKK